MKLCYSKVKSKKINIELLNQNQDIYRYRLTKEEKLEYTEIFFSNAIEEKVFKKDFPSLLGLLGTEIAVNFAFKIFDTFSLSKEYITLQEYLKYVDVYHHGDDNERCLITFKLMDTDNIGKVIYNSFEEYLNLIIGAIRKVHPLSEENLFSKKEMKTLFNKISDNKDYFTFEEFKYIFINKPELLSWIDYFKNNDDEITILINKNIKQLMKLLITLFKNLIKIINSKGIEDKYEYDIFEMICKEIRKYINTVDKIKDDFVQSQSFFNIRNVFDNLINYNKAKDYSKKIISDLENDLKNLYNNYDYDINSSSINNLQKINDHFKILKSTIKNNSNNDFTKNKDLNLTNIIELEEKKSIPNNTIRKSFTKSPSKSLKILNEFNTYSKNDSFSSKNNSNSQILNNFSPQKNESQTTLALNEIKLLDYNNYFKSGNYISFSEKKNTRELKSLSCKFKEIKSEKDYFEEEKNNSIFNFNNLKKSSFSLKNKNENQIKILFNNIGLLSETSYHLLNWMTTSYNWIESKKIKSTLKQHIHNYDTEIINNKHINPIKKSISNSSIINLKSKSKNKFKPTDINFNFLIKIIMGIQLATQNTPNINLINIKNYDLNDYLKSNSYTIESSGSRKRENYFISEYAPVIFNNIRKMFNINKENYINSISPQEFITEIMISSSTIIEQLVSTGKSGSMFYYTKDGRFIIKTISKDEYYFLRKILKDYFIYLKKNINTFLPKYYGCYKLIKKIHNNKERIYFVTMDNIFSTKKEIHLRYDLKGSKVGRQVLNDVYFKKGEKYQYALKDIDFENNTKNIFLNETIKKRILNQIRSDTDFLEEKKIIDYSLLLGIHTHKLVDGDLKKDSNIKQKIYVNLNKQNKEKKNSIHHSNFKEKEINSDFQEENLIYSNITNIDDNSDDTKLNSTFIFNQRLNDFRCEDGGIISNNEDKNQNDIYYMGIIDILTEFKTFKICEYLSKSIIYCNQEMSCIPPSKYKERFNKFINLKIK